MRAFFVVLFLTTVSISYAQFRRPGLRLLLPNAGSYTGDHPDLINWMNANGAPASNFKFGGDLFSLTCEFESKVIVGLAAGGIYGSTTDSHLRVGYGEALLGTPLFSTDRFQISLLGHLTMIGYSIPGIIPPGVATPPTNRYFMRSSTYGGGVSMRLQYLIIRSTDFSLGLGIEGGITWLDPHASWKFGYMVPTSNKRSRFIGTSVPGPLVDSMLEYFRFSVVITGGGGWKWKRKVNRY